MMAATTTTGFVPKILMLLCSVLVALATTSDDKWTLPDAECSDGKVHNCKVAITFPAAADQIWSGFKIWGLLQNCS